MPKKSYKPEEIVAKLRQVDFLTSQGQGVAEAIRSIGVSEVTYYRWRQEFGGLKSDQIKRLKDLETENSRLRRGVGPDLSQGDSAGGGPGKLLSPARRRACIEHVGDVSWTAWPQIYPHMPRPDRVRSLQKFEKVGYG
jgi:putative transposase